MPDRSGSIKSSRTRSQASRATVSVHSLPVPAERISYPADSRTMRSDSTIAGSSSTTRTRLGCGAVLRERALGMRGLPREGEL